MRKSARLHSLEKEETAQLHPAIGTPDHSPERQQVNWNGTGYCCDSANGRRIQFWGLFTGLRLPHTDKARNKVVGKQ